jgi:proteasome lid subunit RPN8/RPN11
MDEMPFECGLVIRDLARVGLPREVCGFVLQDWEVIYIKNVARDPVNEFTMQPDDQLEWMFHRGHELLGIYHSHPSGKIGLSAPDKLMLRLHPNLRFWIATTSDVYEWVLKDDEPCPARLDGTPGLPGMAYPVLETAEALRRTG